MKAITLVLPSGEHIPIALPYQNALETLHQFVEETCKYHIPKSALKQSLQEKRWPNPNLIECPIGKNCLRPEQTWTGTQKDWEVLHHTFQKTEKKKTEEKIQNLQDVQHILNRLTANEWGCLKKVFALQPQP